MRRREDLHAPRAERRVGVGVQHDSDRFGAFSESIARYLGTAQFLVMSGLQRHLAHLIAVESVNVEPLDATLQVTIVYRVLEDGSVQQAGFTVPPGGGGP